MAKVLVLYYSSFGHIETMAHAVAEGARNAGATADVKRVPENVPDEIAKAFYFKLDQPAPIAKVEELASYDAIVVGAPTRFGRMPIGHGELLGAGGAAVDERRLVRKSRRRIHLERDPARRQ